MRNLHKYRGAHVCTALFKEDGADVGSGVVMHSCTDAYSHSNQGVVPEVG